MPDADGQTLFRHVRAVDVLEAVLERIHDLLEHLVSGDLDAIADHEVEDFVHHLAGRALGRGGGKCEHVFSFAAGQRDRRFRDHDERIVARPADNGLEAGDVIGADFQSGGGLFGEVDVNAGQARGIVERILPGAALIKSATASMAATTRSLPPPPSTASLPAPSSTTSSPAWSRSSRHRGAARDVVIAGAGGDRLEARQGIGAISAPVAAPATRSTLTEWVSAA